MLLLVARPIRIAQRVADKAEHHVVPAAPPLASAGPKPNQLGAIGERPDDLRLDVGGDLIEDVRSPGQVGHDQVKAMQAHIVPP
jgi:hypothetical protein